MKITELILFLLLILFISGCGGWTMFGTIIRQDGQGVSDVYVKLEEQSVSGFHTQIKSPTVIETKTDNIGFFRFDNLDKGKEYGVFLSKKVDNEEMLRSVPQENYNFKRFKNEQLVKIKVTEIAIVRGRVVKETIGDETNDMPINKDDNSKLEPINKAIIRLIKINDNGSEILLDNLQTSTDPDGNFTINNINESGNYRLEVNKTDYKIESVNISLNIGEVKDLGIITISPNEIIATPVVTVFTIGQKFKYDLDNEQLTEELQQELTKNGIDLKDAKITKKGELLWLLECTDEAYIIEEIDNSLQVRIKPLQDKSSLDDGLEKPIPNP